MNYEEKMKQIEELKKEFEDNEEHIKSGKRYHRFTIQQIKIPKKLGKPFIQVMFDDENNAYAVVNMLYPMTPEEKEAKREARRKKLEARKKQAQPIKEKIKEAKELIKSKMKDRDFAACEQIADQIEELEKEYKEIVTGKK